MPDFFHYGDGLGRENGAFAIVNEDLSSKPVCFVLHSVIRA